MSTEPDWIYPSDAQRVYDYLDGDGDLLAVDVVEKSWLAVSLRQHGEETVILAVLINDPAEARKLAAQLLNWADDKEDEA